MRERIRQILAKILEKNANLGHLQNCLGKNETFDNCQQGTNSVRDCEKLVVNYQNCVSSVETWKGVKKIIKKKKINKRSMLSQFVDPHAARLSYDIQHI